MQNYSQKSLCVEDCNNAIIHWVFFSFLMNIKENMKIIKIAIKMVANKSAAWRYKLNQKCNFRNAIMP